MHRRYAPLAAPLLLLVLAACPEENSISCPANTSSVGQLTLDFAGQHPAGECVAVSLDGGDGGFLGPLAIDSGVTTSANLCYGQVSGQGQLTLVLPGKSSRTAPLLDGGGFLFVGSTNSTNGTACLCPVNITETFSGNLVPPDPDAGFRTLSDGGIPFPVGLTGTLQDTLHASDAGDPTCACAMPCNVTYGIQGSTF
jgi:hypothetical protein